jgi:hypothetical protein
MLTSGSILAKCKLISLSEVKNLNMWGCDLEEISIVQELINVEVISLSVNKINTLKPFANCLKLTELYLRKNSIEDLSEIDHLMNCKSLKILWLEENPVCMNLNYRNYVMNALPQLLKLDNIPVSSNRREEVNAPLRMEPNNKSSSSTQHSTETNDNTPEIVKKKVVSRGSSSHILSRDDQHKNIFKACSQERARLTPISEIKTPVQVKNEEDYMFKFKNLSDLTKFFSTPFEKEKHIPKFNDSLKNSFTANNFNKKIQQKETNNILPHNNHIIKAINNLLEELNITQLNYVKREIDKKLRGEVNSII